MSDQSIETDSQLLEKIAPVVPVADFDDVAHAAACCELFNELAVPSIEVTLRRANAWESLAECIRLMPAALIGVGTIIEADQLRRAKDIGAAFAISPGLSEELVVLANQLKLPYFPGIASASELMLARSLGLRAVKFFPAEAAGGIAMLKSLGSPFPDMSFCPTGGIGAHNYQDYLALSNVSCVGGSFVIPPADAFATDRDKWVKTLAAVYS